MVYIKEHDYYERYHISDDGRLICTSKDGLESVLLYGISPEFDGVITDDNKIHIVLQDVKGELIYLKKDNGTWKKYSIIKSKKGIQKITNIRIVCKDHNICIFYVMSHKGNNLIVKHMFNQSDIYKEPEILGLCDGIRGFDICTGNGPTLIFKNPDGVLRKIVTDASFKKIKDEKIHTEDEILSICSVCHNNEIYTVYTSPRKNSTALLVCNEKNFLSGKIVTFGITRNCTPHIFFVKETLYVQWEENGVIMQSESFNFGESFSKPISLGGQCTFSKVRHLQSDKEPDCDICAVYNMEPYYTPKKYCSRNNIKGANKKMIQPQHYKNSVNPEADTQKILNSLDAIKDDIDKMSLSLNEICSALDTIKEFKKSIPVIDDLPDTNKSNHTLSEEDIGEIDEENIKLFENTDIDTVLPDKTGDMEVIQ